jgi:hypothetical protein
LQQWDKTVAEEPPREDYCEVILRLIEIEAGQL